MKSLVIAIDGPSGAGKGTLARTLAEKLGYRHVDTGAMYRSVAWKASHEGLPLDDDALVAALAARAVFAQQDGRITIDGHDVTRDIRTPAMDTAAATVARLPQVREVLRARQRQLGAEGGVVMEGRDIGTVVFPDADVKIYLDASAEERARRRSSDSAHTGVAGNLAAVQSDLVARDKADSTRAVAPLTLAKDAIYIDTTEMPIEVVVNHVMMMVIDKLGGLPQAMTPEEFRRAGHKLVDWIADYRANVEGRPVMAQTTPGDIKGQLPKSPPRKGEPFDDIFADVDRVVAPGITNWQHPRFFGYFPSNGLLASVLGDFLSTGFGIIGLAWQSGPALTEIEEVATDWLRQMLGLSGEWSGVIQDTASTSTLVALMCAREKSSNYALNRGGLQAETAPLVVYTTAHSHSSVEKAALLAGFGREHIRVVPHDTNYAMRAYALDALIQADLAAGNRPCAVVATTGTTTSTALDPLAAIAKVTQTRGVWLHVDAAMAGSAMILPECRYMWDGIEQADSLIVNAHKWLGVAFDCSLYYVRDPEHLVRVMSTNPSYLQTAADGKVKNYRDWGLPLGRRFRALKLWFLIREQGVDALQARLRRDLENAVWLKDEIPKSPGWKVLAPVPLQTLCVRHEPDGLSGEALDRHTQAWAARINQSGQAYLTPAILDGQWMVRVSIGAEQTERQHVEQLWALMQKEVLK